MPRFFSHRRGILALIVLFIFLPGRVRSQAGAESEGQLLAAQLREQSPIRHFSGEGVLKYRNRQERLEIPIKLSVAPEGQDWKSICEALSTNGVVMERIEILHPLNQSGQYFITRSNSLAIPAPSQPLAPEQIGIPFANTDFWLCDLGLDFFHWPNQQVVKKEMRKSRSCRVLESSPDDPKKAPYARVRSWIDVETHSLIRAEAYDLNQRLVKEFEILKIARIDGKIQLKQLEIRSPAKGSRTRLEFSFDIAAAKDAE